MPVLTPADIRALLEEHDIRPSRALGQNFLADPNTARRIATLAGIDASTQVLEIGPGLGSLTLALAQAGGRVHCLELDRHVIGALRGVVAAHPSVTVEQADALAYDYERLDPGPWTCVSNLPYNVATPIVLHLLERAPRVTDLLVMVQREVGERLAAPAGSRVCGAVSIKVAYYASARVVASVPASVFVPRPKVESVLVALERRAEPPVDVPSRESLFELVDAGFATRRKMLRRALRPALGTSVGDVLARADLDPTARAEALDLEQWARLARAASAA